MLKWRATVLAAKKNPRFYVSAFLGRANVPATTRNKALYQWLLDRSLGSQHIMSYYDHNSIMERDPKCGNLVMK
jgi:hypothetical protein